MKRRLSPGRILGIFAAALAAMLAASCCGSPGTHGTAGDADSLPLLVRIFGGIAGALLVWSALYLDQRY